MRAEDVLPGPVPIPCWRCGQDTSAAFDLIRVPRTVAVCRGGCVPTVVRANPYGVVIPLPAEEPQ